MQKYKSKNESSGVLRYESGLDYIKIEFHDHKVYLYNYQKPGKEHVENMKRLALSSKGLSTYINVHVRENYALKIS